MEFQLHIHLQLERIKLCRQASSGLPACNQMHASGLLAEE